MGLFDNVFGLSNKNTPARVGDFSKGSWDANLVSDKFLEAYPELSADTRNLIMQGRTQGNIDQVGKNLTSGIDVFKNNFKLQAGQDASAADVNNYVQRSLFPSWVSQANLSYADHVNGANAFIANNYDIAKLQADKGKQDAVGQAGTVNDIFKSSVGREATKEEKQHFGELLANNSLDSYGLNEWIKQLPENVTKQDAAFRNTLRTETSANDAKYFNEQITPGLQANATRQGRSLDATGIQNSLAMAAQAQNTQREGFLTNLAAAQYGGNQQNAYNAYLNSQNRQQGVQDYYTNRFNISADQGIARSYEIQNYNMQKQAYDSYLQRYGKRSGSALGAAGMGMASGAASGAMIGSAFGPGYGTAIGAGIGGIFGGATGYFGYQG